MSSSLLLSVGHTAEAIPEATRMTAAGEPGLQTLTFALLYIISLIVHIQSQLNQESGVRFFCINWFKLSVANSWAAAKMADNEVHGRPLTQVGFLRQLLQPEPQREPETRPSPQRQLQELGPPVPVRVCAPRQRASSHSSWSVRWPCLLQVVFQPQLLQAEEPQSQQSLQLRVRIRWKGTKTTSDTQLSPFTFTTLSHLWCYMSAAEDKKGLPKTFRDILNWRGREKCYCIL